MSAGQETSGRADTRRVLGFRLLLLPLCAVVIYLGMNASGVAAGLPAPLVRALAVLAAGLVLAPCPYPGAPVIGPLARWAAVVGLVSGTVTLAAPAAMTMSALAAFTVCLSLLAMGRTVGGRGTWATGAFALAGFLLLATAPAWLASGIAGQPPEALIQAIVVANPATPLAVALEIDLFRGEWFYRVSPLGSLRYAYPAWSVLAAAHLVTGAVLLLVIHHRRASGSRGVLTRFHSPLENAR